MGFLKSVLFITVLLLLPPPISFAAVYSWTFEDHAGLPGWETPGTTVAVQGSNLVIKGNPPKIISPPFDIPSANTAFTVKLKSASGGIGILALELGERKTVAVKMFRVNAGDNFSVIRLYNGDILPPSDRIVRFALQFMTGTGEVEISSVGFHDPGLLETMRLLWQGLWEPSFVKSTTINFVSTPRIGRYSLLLGVYIIIAVIISSAIAFYLFKKRRMGGGVARAFAASFALAAFFLAFRTDYDFAYIWRDDVRNLSGKSMDERVASAFSMSYPAFSDFYAFIKLMKKEAPPGALLRPAVRAEGDHLALLAKYFLLPVRTSAKGNYLWTYKDPVSFDPSSGTLFMDSKPVVANLNLVASYGDKGALYEITGEGVKDGEDAVKGKERGKGVAE